MLWILLAICPYDRHDWALENVLVVVFCVALAATYRRFVFSRLSYTLIFLFLCLHAVGAHYTYAMVPYDAWWQALTGRTFNSLWGWERNHFDRLVHLLYGLLLAYPIRKVFLRFADARGFWGYFLPLDVTLASSALFELSNGARPSSSAATWAWPTSARRATCGTRTRIWRSPRWEPCWRC